jgi:hypothetical protein
MAGRAYGAVFVGGATPEGASFLGHCAACWAAVALSLAGAVMLALPRGDRRA